MFSSLKTKLNHVQEVCSNSLKNLKIDRKSRIEDDQRKALERTRAVNIDGGVELLERYHNMWADIHKKTENAVLCAQEVDEIVTRLHDRIDGQFVKVEELALSFARVPKLVHGVQIISDTILNLQCAFDETEDALGVLEDLIETAELREKQLDHRFQLALYQERRIAELDDLKSKLTDDHLKKVEELEKKKAREAKERQVVFQCAFEEDLQQFKSKGTLPKSSSGSTHSNSLEEIELAEEDPIELESFLQDMNEENPIQDEEKDLEQSKESNPHSHSNVLGPPIHGVSPNLGDTPSDS